MACICPICQREELGAHRRNFHSALINLKFSSRNDSITVKRGDDQLFKCPKCAITTDNYQVLYNHWRRNHSHNHERRAQVDCCIESRNLVPEVNTGEVSRSLMVPDIQDTDMEMAVLEYKSWTSSGLDIEIRQVRTLL
jgi:hypothetical protein